MRKKFITCITGAISTVQTKVSILCTSTIDNLQKYINDAQSTDASFSVPTPHSNTTAFMKTLLRKSNLFAVAFLVVNLLLVSGAWGQANFSSNSATGNWSVAASWTLTSGTDSDGIPDADDNVTILAGHVRTVNGISSANSIIFSSTGTAGRIDIASPNSLTVTAN